MYSLLKDEEKYLENIDLVKQWDYFQDAACRLKDLYSDTMDGAKNLSNFISTIKSVECYYRNTVDILIQKKKRYHEYGSEMARIKLLRWYCSEARNQNLDKIHLFRRIYGKQLRLKRKKKFQRIDLVITNGDANYIHSNKSLIDVNDYATLIDGCNSNKIMDTSFVKCETFNRKKTILKRQIDIFNDAVDLKNLQGHLSEFELNDSQCRSFIFTNPSPFCQPPREKRRRLAKDH